MLTALGAGALAGLGVALPLGAIGALLVRLPSTVGLGTAAAGALGVATTDGLYAAVAVTGGASAAAALHPVARPLQLASASVLLLLAGLTLTRARRPVGSVATRRMTPARAYAGFVALTALNPATLAYFVALVLGTRPGGTWFVVGVFVASAAWQLVLVGSGAVLTRHLTTGRGRTGLAVASAAVMVVAAVRALAAPL